MERYDEICKFWTVLSENTLVRVPFNFECEEFRILISAIPVPENTEKESGLNA